MEQVSNCKSISLPNFQEIQSRNSFSILKNVLTSEVVFNLENDSSQPETTSSKTDLDSSKKITHSPEDNCASPEQCQIEDLGCDENFSKKDYSSEEDFSENMSKNHLIVPKVARRLCPKNAKRKFVSMREARKLKSKKQPQKKKPSFDNDFLEKEWDKLHSDSESQDEDDPVSHHECHICHRSYVHYKSLKRHMNTHSKHSRIMFPCQNCGATFDKKSDLKKHERTHFGNCPFKCKKCGSTFTQSAALKRHEKIHLDVKPYSCTDCAASFMQSFSLTRHQKIHEQLKEFECEFCKKTFTEKRYLQAHVNSLHSNEAAPEKRHYTCNICGATFSENSSLRFHEKIHDRNESDDYEHEQISNFKSNSLLNSESFQKGAISKTQLTKPHVQKKKEFASTIKDCLSSVDDSSQIKKPSDNGQVSLVLSPDKTRNISNKNNGVENGLFKDYTLEECNATNIDKMDLSNSFECLNSELAEDYPDSLAAIENRISVKDSKLASSPCYSVDSLKQVSPKTPPKIPDIGHGPSSRDTILKILTPPPAEISMEKNRSISNTIKRNSENCLSNEISLIQDGRDTNSQEIQSRNSSRVLEKILTSDVVFNPENNSSHSETISSKTDLDSSKNITNLPDDDSASPEQCQTEHLDHDENFSKKELTSKEDVSESVSKNHQIEPKVTRRLGTKNEKQKFVPMREERNPKSKKQHQKKKASFDSDFLEKEWDELDSDSESLDEDDPDSTSGSHHECNICHRSYIHDKSLKRHMKTHSKRSRIMFPCQNCDATFDTKSDLKKHERTHLGNRPFKCEECGSTFTQSSALRRHERIHLDVKPYSCPDCAASFTQSFSLTRHRRIHLQIKEFECEFCKKAFTEKQHLQAHINSLHSNEATQEKRHYTCNICGATFLRNSSLWFHKKIHDRNKSDNYECEVCHKKFSSRYNLNRHCRQAHSKTPEDEGSEAEKPFACSVCDERFSRNVSLKLHLRSHNKKDLYHCHSCEKVFTHKQWLKKHLVSHKNGSKYTCEQCGRTFRGSFQLGVHKKSAGGNCTRPINQNFSKTSSKLLKHVCKYCNLRFSLSSRLAKHIRKTHPEVEVFTCDVCEKGFYYYLDFLSHRRTHRNIPYQCKTCEVAFPRHYQLLQHCKDHLNPLQASVASSASPNPSSASRVLANNDILENSSKPRTENDLEKVSCSKMESENFVTEASSSEEALNADSQKNPEVPGQILKTPEVSGKSSKNPKVSAQISENVKCQICHLVFLTKFSHRKHCWLVHGEKKFPCQECDKRFELRQLLKLHMKNSHPKPNLRTGRKPKSKKLVQPKTAVKFNPAVLEKLFRDKVKEAMMRSKVKQASFGASKKKNITFTANSYIID